MMYPTQFPLRYRRRGVTLMISLVALAVASMILFSLLKTLAGRHRMIEASVHKEQARWLAESGLEKAAQQLSQGADYDGERWEIDASELDGVHSGLVVVTVQPAASPRQFTIRSQARFPAGDLRGAQYTVTADVASPRPAE